MDSLRFTRGFSLVELVVVVVVLGVIGAIAIPRMSKGATGANESALESDLAALRLAIDIYTLDHNEPPTDADSIANQLILFSDESGNTSAVQTGAYQYGPYLTEIPPLPVGKNEGSNAVRGNGTPGAGSEGWFYDKDAGTIYANTKNAETDESGVAFNTY